MSFPSETVCKIWGLRCQIWPDFAKSEICYKSEIWLLSLIFNGLTGEVQIWLAALPNLETGLDYQRDSSGLCQISDLAPSTPKGVGGLPPQGGEVHHPPLGIFLGPNSGHGRCLDNVTAFHPHHPIRRGAPYG